MSKFYRPDLNVIASFCKFHDSSTWTFVPPPDGVIPEELRCYIAVALSQAVKKYKTLERGSMVRYNIDDYGYPCEVMVARPDIGDVRTPMIHIMFGTSSYDKWFPQDLKIPSKC